MALAFLCPISKVPRAMHSIQQAEKHALVLIGSGGPLIPQLTGVEAPRIRGPSAVAVTLFTLPAGNIGKDTVLITLTIFRRAWHIQQDQLCILGLVEDDTIELHCSVHPPDVGLVPGRRVVQQAAQWA